MNLSELHFFNSLVGVVVGSLLGILLCADEHEAPPELLLQSQCL